MKILKTIFLMLTLSIYFVANAQTPKPVPKLVTDNDDKSWKEFVDENFGFKVLVVGSLTTNETNQEIDYGTVKSTTFVWKTSVAQYNVICTEYPYLPTDSESIKNNYNFIKDDFAKKGMAIVSEKDITLENYLGREFLLETGNTRIRTRLFYVGNTRYQINFGSASTNLSSKSFTSFYETTSSKFLDSFKLTNSSLAKAASEVAESKAPNPFDLAEFKGKVENFIYTNDFLGMSFKLPEKWVIMRDDEFDFAVEKGFEDFSNGTPTAKKIENIARKNVRKLIGVSKEQLGTTSANSNIICLVEKLPIKSMTANSYVNISRKIAKESLENVEPIGDISWTKLGGKEFGVFILRMQKEDLRMNVNYYLTVHKGVGFGFVFIYFNDEDKKLIETVLQSLTFK